MLEKSFYEVYTKFKLHFYQGIFERLQERESTLSASEAYAAEVIHALDGPTIGEFAEFLHVSKPNATYKVNAMVKKGYVEKIQSETDGREFHLRTTDRFEQYWAINSNYLETVMERIHERFTPEEVAKFDEFLAIISDELMPEIGTTLELNPESEKPTS
jgi:DNA-binding MarR family transcriptional regulator